MKLLVIISCIFVSHQSPFKNTNRKERVVELLKQIFCEKLENHQHCPDNNMNCTYDSVKYGDQTVAQNTGPYCGSLVEDNEQYNSLYDAVVGCATPQCLGTCPSVFNAYTDSSPTNCYVVNSNNEQVLKYNHPCHNDIETNIAAVCPTLDADEALPQVLCGKMGIRTQFQCIHDNFNKQPGVPLQV